MTTRLGVNRLFDKLATSGDYCRLITNGVFTALTPTLSLGERGL